MRKAVWLGVCALALGFEAGVACANVVTVAVTGHVTSVIDPSLGVTVGQAVTGTYSYDASTPTSGSPPSGSGLTYQLASPPASITLSLTGGATYQSQNNWAFQISVWSGPEYAFSYVATSPQPGLTTQLAVNYSDNAGQWLGGSASLPVTAPVLNPNTTGTIYIAPPGSWGFYVQTDSATLVPSITVSPSSGSFIAQQSFDAVLLLSAQLSVTSMQASVGGAAIGLSYPGTCQLAQANNAQRTALICPNAAAVLATLGGGPVTINWLVTLADGSTLQQTVIWKLVL
jgi:hypothetical protein